MTDRLDESIFGTGSAPVPPSQAQPVAAPSVPGPTVPDPPASRRARRELAEQQAHNRGDEAGQKPPPGPKSRRARRGLVLLIALALVGGGAVGAVTVLKPMIEGLNAPQDYPGPGTGSVTFVVKSGDTGRAIADRLKAAGVVLTSDAFAAVFSATPEAAGIQPGSYELRKQMSSSDALDALLDPANRTVPRVTVREGLWASEVYAVLSRGTGIPLKDYSTAAKQPEKLGLPPEAKGAIEGYLFPATYEFAADATAADQLATMIETAVKQLDDLGVSPAKAHRVLTLASILEAEAKTDEDRRKVHRVLLNRLDAGMRLQLDSTVSYAAKRRSITTTDSERASSSPYNTYAQDGLPPGPIGNPGKAALEAAIDPAEGPWLYFVAVNPETGETKYATTFAEHQTLVAQFQQWCRAHPGVC
jgi:UPF0755 protein